MTVVTVLIQAIIYRIWPTDATIDAVELVVLSLASALVYARTQADVDSGDWGSVWSRALERAWAVIVITFLLEFVTIYAYAGLAAGNFLDRILGVAILMMSLALSFSDIDAVISREGGLLLMLPRSFSNSIRAAWSGWTMVRIIGVFLAQKVLQLAIPLIAGALAARHASGASFWAVVPLDALLLPPFAILTTFIYFDAIRYEPAGTCDE